MLLLLEQKGKKKKKGSAYQDVASLLLFPQQLLFSYKRKAYKKKKHNTTGLDIPRGLCWQGIVGDLLFYRASEKIVPAVILSVQAMSWVGSVLPCRLLIPTQPGSVVTERCLARGRRSVWLKITCDISSDRGNTRWVLAAKARG